LYAFLLYATNEPTSFANSLMPTNTPIGTFDNGPYMCDSYYWGRLQYPHLSTTDLYNVTTNDIKLARMRHWLGGESEHTAYNIDTLGIQRDPSPDQVLDGQLTWYDYAGKANQLVKGNHVLPDVVARVLPDGSTWYEWTRRNEWFQPTNFVGTYTKLDGTIGTRTNVNSYYGNGQDLLQVIGPNGERTVSNYVNNAYHQIDRSYDALAQETIFTYNSNRQLTSLKRPAGLTTTNLYFTSGTDSNRLATNIDLEIARTNSYTYYSNGLVATLRDERNLVTTNFWDNLQRLTGRTFAETTGFSSISNVYTYLDVTAAKDRMGFWTYFGFNPVRQKVAETNANGVVTRYGYCDCGALLSVTNAWSTAIAQVTTFEYDYQGNRLVTRFADSYNMTNWFDSLRRPSAAGDGVGYHWFFYNNQGLQTVVSNALGAESTKSYDMEDRPVYITDANGVTVTSTFDDLGRLRTRTYPDGGVEAFGYSARGMTAYTNEIGQTNFYVYDAAGRKTFETNANWELVQYQYDPSGNLTNLVDGKNQTTKWKYDQFGRVTNKTDQANVEILRYQYDLDNRLTNRWSKEKLDTKYAYDPAGNLTNIDYNLSTDIRFQYDPLNRLTNMVDASGTTKFAWTAGNQLWTEDGPFTSDTVTNTYVNRLRTALALQQPRSGLTASGTTPPAAWRTWRCPRAASVTRTPPALPPCCR
jgi:YD repeat-containing protein